MDCHVELLVLENQRKVRKQRQSRLVSVARTKAIEFQEPIRSEKEGFSRLCEVHGFGLGLFV